MMFVLTNAQINFTCKHTCDQGSLIVTAHEARLSSYLGCVLCMLMIACPGLYIAVTSVLWPFHIYMRML